jgi:hypothetical protein
MRLLTWVVRGCLGVTFVVGGPPPVSSIEREDLVMEHAHNAEGWRIASLRALSCGWVLLLCFGIGLWIRGLGADLALLTAGSLCVTLSMVSYGSRKTALRLTAMTLLLSAAWLLAHRLSIFAV